MNRLPDEYIVPLDRLIQNAIHWLVDEWRPLFQALRWPIAKVLDGVSDGFEFLPFWLVILGFLALGWVIVNFRTGLLASGSFAAIAFLGLWDEAMISLSILVTAVVFCVLIGVPLGILSGRSDRFWAVLRPVLDIMQTTPSFVYLVPVVMLFGIGTVPGVIATIVFSMPPIIRLTNLGLRQVPADAIEAGEAFGSTEWQALMRIRLPLALPSVMAGLNQTLLMAMVMSVIIAMIGAEGLGLTVLRGIGSLDVGLAGIGGIAIVLMAITLDRITQGLGQPGRISTDSSSSLWRRFRQRRQP
ncbi:proline/glycine betaine ABC transporter permease [Pseudohalocynthiibacter aestuariivivens]|uniref:Proline/glycine betaine ABC transporter permease n=1 Tax=Roseovarius pelagicus TaxID=2980108 RepID=A0ABY6D6J5_9RHOB|nr:MULTISPECIES: proline/glycine betaine ABC transporter permease [Rhodobacterales]QIE46268.1 proline/glycine betaine ABC transporter permease [Pseudohalocynthiibacter aestuariivivens]UXX81756.1 proline/glycine betaine ABC transporter permease [Roseovarius pelagicus]